MPVAVDPDLRPRARIGVFCLLHSQVASPQAPEGRDIVKSGQGAACLLCTVCAETSQPVTRSINLGDNFLCRLFAASAAVLTCLRWRDSAQGVARRRNLIPPSTGKAARWTIHLLRVAACWNLLLSTKAVSYPARFWPIATASWPCSAKEAWARFTAPMI